MTGNSFKNRPFHPSIINPQYLGDRRVNPLKDNISVCFIDHEYGTEISLSSFFELGDAHPIRATIPVVGPIPDVQT